MSKRKKWLIGVTAVLGASLGGIFFAARHYSRRFEPYIRQRAIEYLSKRFESEVEMAELRVQLPAFSPLKLWMTRGRGVLARVEGDGVLLRHRGRRDLPPMFAMKRFYFDVDLGRLFDPEKHIAQVVLEGMAINIPPKGDRPDFNKTADDEAARQSASVVLADVLINDATLTILPKIAGRKPLEFALHNVRLEKAGAGRQMQYTAKLTNPKPPGLVESQGTFGPWNASEPGDTPLGGVYEFSNADLGVFPAIAGILHSTGKFNGTLSNFDASGEADIPDFRLRRSGQRVPLHVQFDVTVDGTNGNTILKPVRARLGSTAFRTSGGIVKHDGDQRRRISLDVSMPGGDMRDVMRLAVKGPPMMEGKLRLNARIEIPPLSGKVIEKLLLDGKFDIGQGKFLQSNIQDKIDSLSRRGQGQPKSEAIDEVFSRMTGKFRLEDQTMTLQGLSFGVPGASVNLDGTFDLDADVLDFHGALRLDAKVSQTMSGWKRIALKPVDPFFAKNGAGTFVRIQVTGSTKDPQFGRDKRK